MTYTERYNVIIHYFQRHPVDKKKIYCETHHIVPASCGGSNKKENLVNLPAAWHYRVHCYLPFMMKEQNNEVGYYKMLRAWKRCLNSSSEKIDLMKINKECLEYKILREAEANLQSVRSKNFHKNNPNFIKGNKNPMTGKHWWKDPSDKTKSMAIKDGDPIPEGWVRGHWHSEHLKVTHTEHCSYCGAEKGKCSNPEICKRYQIFPTLIKYFSFDETAIGSNDIFLEIEKCKMLVSNMYEIRKMSLPEIAMEIGYKSSPGHLCRILDFLNIPRRSRSNAVKNYLKKQK